MDQYLATIQTILNRREKNNTPLSVNDIETVRICLANIIKCRYGITQSWLVPLIERVQKEFDKSYKKIDDAWL